MKCSGATLFVLLAVLGGAFLTLGPAQGRQAVAADLCPLALRAAHASDETALGSEEETLVEDTPGHFDAGPLPDDELATESPVTTEPSPYRFEYPEGEAGYAEHCPKGGNEGMDRETAAETMDDARDAESVDNEMPCRETPDREPADNEANDQRATTGEETKDVENADDETAAEETPEDAMTDEETPDDEAADEETTDDEADATADDPADAQSPTEHQTVAPNMADDRPAEDQSLEGENAEAKDCTEREASEEPADGGLPSQERDASIDQTPETPREGDALQDTADTSALSTGAGGRGEDVRASVGLLADVLQRVVLRAVNGTAGALWNAWRDLSGIEWPAVLRGWTDGRLVDALGRAELWIPR